MFYHLLHFGQTYTFTSTGPTQTHVNVAAILAILAFAFIITIFFIVSFWKVFTKAGRPGWASIIPIYSSWVLFEIAGKPGWWSLLLLVPFVNIIGAVLELIAFLELSQKFGKSSAFGAVLFLLPFIGFPILAFGKATYNSGQSGIPPNNPVVPPPPASPVAPTPSVSPVMPGVTPMPSAPQVVTPPSSADPNTTPQAPTVVTPQTVTPTTNPVVPTQASDPTNDSQVHQPPSNDVPQV